MAPIKQPDEDQATLLARVDERTLAMQEAIDRIAERMDEQYVTKAEFRPVRGVVYGLVALVMTATVGALLDLIRWR
ncbi:hypothetical protein HED60_15055 [Planctomycetales bacterium ZRK34]|nr:hypothetical protein HED60_15055 [Planctomycetales bacterium ZRK34]